MTKITIRKANQLQQELRNRLSSLHVNPLTAIGLFDDADMVVCSAQQRFEANLERKTNLMRAHWWLRKHIGIANSNSGIQESVTEINALKAECSILENLVDRASGEEGNLDAIKSNLQMQREKDRLLMGGLDFRLITDEKLEEYLSHIRRIKKQIADLNDECAEKNAITHIKLDGHVEEVLKAEDMI